MEQARYCACSHGQYRRRVNGRDSLVDSTQGYLQQTGDEEFIQHVGGAGHRCIVIEVRSEDLPALLHVRSRLVATEFRTDPAVDLAHRQLLAECRRGGHATVIIEMGRTLVTDLLADWAHSLHPTRRRGTAAATRRIIDIARELAASSDIPPPRRSIASAASISPQYLSRVFKQGTGLTLTRCRSRVRVRQALERLAGGDEDMKRIAHELGFLDTRTSQRQCWPKLGCRLDERAASCRL
jgi:transcriptional regulator GlxA family with amidase domain